MKLTVLCHTQQIWTCEVFKQFQASIVANDGFLISFTFEGDMITPMIAALVSNKIPFDLECVNESIKSGLYFRVSPDDSWLCGAHSEKSCFDSKKHDCNILPWINQLVLIKENNKKKAASLEDQWRHRQSILAM